MSEKEPDLELAKLIQDEDEFYQYDSDHWDSWLADGEIETVVHKPKRLRLVKN